MNDLHHRYVVCGWHGHDEPQLAANTLLERIGAPPSATLAEHSLGALHVRAGAAGDVFADDRLLVVVQGRPREANAARTRLGAGDIARRWRGDAGALLAELHGQFSLLVYDRQADLTALATDWFGTHPLCFARTNDGRLAFASDARLLAAHPGVDSALSPQALYHYLYFHMVPSPRTIYGGITRLEPAQLLVHDRNGLRLDYYWKARFLEKPDKPAAALATELRDELHASVAAALDDKAVAAFLSGGLDSSTVAGLLSKLVEPARAYSIGFEAQGYDEMEYARTAARHFSLEHHEYYVTPADVHAAIAKIAQAYDEPYGNSSAIPAYYCASVAERDGVRLMLAGDGGDELFGGNARYVEQKILGFYENVPAFLRRTLFESWLAAVPAGRLPPLRKLQSYVRQASQPMPDRLERWNYFTREGTGAIVTPELLERIDSDGPLKLLRSVYARTSGESLLNSMLALDWKQTLADNDLRKVSRTCALAGVEVDFPFLDAGIVELSTRVPSDLKIRGLTLRAFYKDAMKGFLPDEILRKSKHGFGLPFGTWLRTHGPLRELAFDSLATLSRRGIVRPDYLDELRRKHETEHAAYYGELIWVLTVLELWLGRHAPGWSLT